MKRILNLFFLISLLLAVPGSRGAASSSTSPLAGPARQAGIEFFGQLVYIGEDGNLWVWRGGETAPQAVTADASETRSYSNPRWSPDGHNLAYCREDTGEAPGTALLVMRTNIWQPFQVAEGVRCSDNLLGGLAWDPESDRLVFAPEEGAQATTGGARGLVAINVRTGERFELVPPPGGQPLAAPSWSPDGRWLRLYELLSEEGLGVLRTWYADTGALYSWVGLQGELFPGYASWAPDGRQMVFDVVTYEGYPGAGLFIAAPDGQGMRTLYHDPYLAAMLPLWSPDGAWIAFQQRAFGPNATNPQLGLITPSGEGLKIIANAENEVAPVRWAPDGSALLLAESTAAGIRLKIYTLSSGGLLDLGPAGSLQADWSLLPAAVQSSATSGPRTIGEFDPQDDLLLLQAPNYQLKVFSPATGKEAALSDPLAFANFWPSPSGRRLVTADKILSLDLGEDGALVLSETSLPEPPRPNALRWSPDESRLAYQDTTGKFWLVGLDGKSLEIPGAGSLPAWSADGRWLAYCSGSGALWVVGGGEAPRQVANRGQCPPLWSPQGSRLAFQEGAAGSGAVMVLQAGETEARPLVQEGRLLGWSPDGRLLAYTVAAREGLQAALVDVASGTELALGLLPGEAQAARWYPAVGAYQFGPYRIAADLSSVSELPGAVYASAFDGRTYLLAETVAEELHMDCYFPQSGEQRNLLSLPISPTLTISPGLSLEAGSLSLQGAFSPSGEWAAFYLEGQASDRYHLGRCDLARRQELPIGGQRPTDNLSGGEAFSPGDPDSPGDAFSPHGRWYRAAQASSGRAAQLTLYDLALSGAQTVQVLSGSPARWLLPLTEPAPLALVVTGRVVDEQEAPLAGVQLYLDGYHVADSGADGNFVIPGVSPGRHTLAPQMKGRQFDPAAVQLTLEEDSPLAEFSALPVEVPVPEVAPSPEPETSPEPEAAVPTGLAGWLDWLDWARDWAVAYLAILPWPYVGAGALGVVLLLVGAGALRRRARRRRAALASELLDLDEEPIESQKEGDLAPEAGLEAEAGAPLEEPGMPAVSSPERLGVLVDAPAQPKGTPEIRPAGPALRGGIERIKRGDYRQGAAVMRQILQAEPDNATAWLWLGIAAGQLDNRRLSERCLRQAQKLGHPKAAHALEMLQRQ